MSRLLSMMIVLAIIAILHWIGDGVQTRSIRIVTDEHGCKQVITVHDGKSHRRVCPG